jgi:bla regulator protein blaR1
VINHLWQSTVFAILAAILTLAFRKNRAQVRYWLWLSASVKFLIPFSLLMSVGSNLEWAPAVQTIAMPVVSSTMVQFTQPFPEAVSFVPSTTGTLDWVPMSILGVWACGFAVIALIRIRGWLRVRGAIRASFPLEISAPVDIRPSPGLLEPGVVGFLRPVLLLPEGIAECLTPRQLEAVLAHELCHVSRRDNLTSAIHMIVEAVFWFHPFVWWIGARLVDERERACDEAVLSLGNEPQVYAEGILNVCKIYVESPLRCVSGVTGSDLKRRIQAILTERVAGELNFVKRVALAVAGIAVLALPVIIGILNAPTIQAQSPPANTPRFEVASIKPCKEADNGPSPKSSPGRLVEDCHELLNLIGNAYNEFADGHVARNSVPAPINGGPSWLRSASYAINAKAEGNPSVAMMLGPMMQRLLEDRFQLKIHRETREGPVYFLDVARGGPKLHPFAEGSCTPWSVPPPPLLPGTRYCGTVINLRSSSVEALGTTVDEFSKTLPVDRPVIDKTGITGRFDIRVKFSREGTGLAAMPRVVAGSGSAGGQAAPSDPTDPPSIFVALPEQLGLRLESGRGPVDTLVIDHIERPTEN